MDAPDAPRLPDQMTSQSLNALVEELATQTTVRRNRFFFCPHEFLIFTLSSDASSASRVQGVAETDRAMLYAYVEACEGSDDLVVLRFVKRLCDWMEAMIRVDGSN